MYVSDSTSITINTEVADKNGDDVINSDDLDIIRKELLGVLNTSGNASEAQVTTLSAVDATDKVYALAVACDEEDEKLIM